MKEIVEGALPDEAELVEAQISGGPLLTLLVDRENGTLDHEFCRSIAAVVSPALEEVGFDGMFEVSSPGIERPLTKPDHFRRFIGHEAKVKVSEQIEGRRNFTGEILSAGDETFSLQLLEGGAEVELPFSSVSRAYLKEEIYT